ncbi:MAG: hypothetical protein ACOH2J_13505 [Allorhizobium sp.]
MIEYALLFGLGFLTAAMVAMLLAPAIQHRIVVYTENRFKATMPLSPQEIRAQKDMARAVYAAENAKTVYELGRSREKTLQLQLKNDTLSRDASRLWAEAQDVHAQIEEMSVEAGNLRSQIRREEGNVTHLKEALVRTEELAAAKDLEIDRLTHRLDRKSVDMDNMRIEKSTAETEIENLKMRIHALRDEREELRRGGSLSGKRAKDAEMRLTQEEHKLIRLDDRLARAMAENVDRDAALERRAVEIDRLKAKLKQANASARAAVRALRAANLPVPTSADDFKDEPDEGSVPMLKTVEALDPVKLASELHHQHTALTERLVKAKSATSDEALREEVAEIAAKMVVLTALREGKSSPIPKILTATTPKSAGAPKSGGSRPSLADRVARISPATLDPSAR